MRIQVKVKTNAKKNQVEEKPDGTFLVSVTKIPAHGKANEQVIKILAKHFKVAPSLIEISSGITTKQKIIVIHK